MRAVSAPNFSASISAPTTLPLDFDILAPSAITMPCVKRRRGRLAVANQADIPHHLGEEARIDQVQNGVLHAADVLIDFEPVGDLRGIERRAVVVRIAVAVEIPGRIDKGVHGVGFAAGRAAAFRAGDIDELGNVFERRAAAAGDFDVGGKAHRKLIVGHRHHAAVRAVNHGNGSAPVALPRNAPILDAEGDGGLAEAFFRGIGGHPAARFFARQAGPRARILHHAILGECRLACRARRPERHPPAGSPGGRRCRTCGRTRNRARRAPARP